MAESLFLSPELIYLMNWLLKHEKTRVRLLIKHAIANGLGAQLNTIELHPRTRELKSEKALHHIFLDFLSLLENALLGALEKNVNNEAIQENLIGTLNELNLENIDATTLWTSFKQAKQELEKEQQDLLSPNQLSSGHVKEVLLEKLLKNWRPHKQAVH